MYNAKSRIADNGVDHILEFPNYISWVVSRTEFSLCPFMNFQPKGRLIIKRYELLTIEPKPN